MRRFSVILSSAAFSAAFSFGARADEGMWPFHQLPMPSTPWLENLKGAALGMGGGSASFVSRDGLVITNAHVVADCARDLSKPGKDLAKLGFHARTRAEELRCPGTDVKRLESYEDVTAKLAGTEGAERQRRITAIERECRESTKQRCEVVKLHRGAEAWLYRSRVWDDVRLVFLPESDVAYFGQDTDDYVYPRHDLDFAFVRVYENGKPVSSPAFLRPAAKGVAEGDRVYSAGHPFSTDRQLTVAELLLLRDQLYPLRISLAADVHEALTEYGKKSPEARRQADGILFNSDSALKVWRGEAKALAGDRLIARKKGDENELRRAWNTQTGDVPGSRLSKQEGDPWERIERAVAKQNARAFETTAVAWPHESLAAMANDLVALADQSRLPDAERLPAYREGKLRALRERLIDPTPVHAELEIVRLATMMDTAMGLLGFEHPYVQFLTRGNSDFPRAARALVGNSRLVDPAFRKSLVDGGWAAVAASDDPLLAMVRDVYPRWLAVQRFTRDEVVAVKDRAYDDIARARLLLRPKAAPDASHSLRLTMGKVAGYDREGVLTPWMTTFHGLYDRHAGLASNPHFQLPGRWKAAEKKLALSTPLNLATTLDTIGGSSGSPIVDARGELVGLVFDGNLEAMGNRFAYSDRSARSLAVDLRAVLHALDRVYDARALLKELGR